MCIRRQGETILSFHFIFNIKTIYYLHHIYTVPVHILYLHANKYKLKLCHKCEISLDGGAQTGTDTAQTPNRLSSFFVNLCVVFQQIPDLTHLLTKQSRAIDGTPPVENVKTVKESIAKVLHYS